MTSVIKVTKPKPVGSIHVWNLITAIGTQIMLILIVNNQGQSNKYVFLKIN